MGKEKKKYDVLAQRTYKKSNDLINAKGKGTLLSTKLFAIGMQNLTIDEATNKVYTEISYSELCKIFGRRSGSLYTAIEEITDKTKSSSTIFDWQIMLKVPERDMLDAKMVVTDAHFEKGVLRLGYNPDLTPQIVHLKNNYTVLSLKETMSMKSVYSLRIMELLKEQYGRAKFMDKSDGVKVFEYPIIELKMDLGIVPATDNRIKKELAKDYPDYDKVQQIVTDLGLDKYKPSDFMRYVVNKAIEEINKNCSTINARAEDIRKARKIVAVRFYTWVPGEPEKKEEAKATTEAIDDAIDAIYPEMHGDFTMKELRKLAETANGNTDRILGAYRSMLAYSKPVKSTMAFMIKGIKEGFEVKSREPDVKPVKNTFTNFPQRKYSKEDYARIEEKMRRNN